MTATYRISFPASVSISVRANSDDEALRLATTEVIAANIDGVSIELDSADGLSDDADLDARVYPTDDAYNGTGVTIDNVVVDDDYDSEDRDSAEDSAAV